MNELTVNMNAAGKPLSATQEMHRLVREFAAIKSEMKG